MSPFPFTSTLDELYELLDEVTFNQVMASLNNGDTVIFNHSGNTTSLRFGTPSTNGVFRTLHIDAASGKVDFDEIPPHYSKEKFDLRRFKPSQVSLKNFVQ
jgi:hypothetical protein